ncbi:HELICASE PROTEIN MOM1 [Salix koriyanagi]|uniref:HELICASE PROTEIN MOM1 n=1 Tax=Salix koriyanagi TaxID=2511006 RepID=A0A9Q0P7U6_9ROSI|nr:HELICASE PROTEIN MOM1 [Salix koriyanagi]
MNSHVVFLWLTACRMGNDTKASRKGKDEVSNDIRGTNIGSRSSSSLGAANDTCGLRKSTRETSSKKNMTPSPSSSRKSERIEKQTPPTIPPATRKSERLVEKQSLSTPSRRPERGKNQSSSSSPGSKKSGKSLGSSIAKEKHKKVKSVKQLETEEVGNSDKPVIKTVQVGIKRMDARAYRELFKKNQKKAKLEGSQDLTVNKTPGVDNEAKSGYKVMSSKQKRSIDDLNFDVDSVDSCSERQRLKKRSKVTDNNTDSPSLKAALKGTSGAPVHKMSQVMPSSVDLNTIDENHVSNGTLLTSKLSQVLKADMVGCNEGMNLHDSEKSLHHFLKPEIAKLCEILQLPENVKVMVELFLEYVLNNHHVSSEPPSLLQAFQLSLKFGAGILDFSDPSLFLSPHVSAHPLLFGASAFADGLFYFVLFILKCWTAASMLKHKLDHKESLALAKEHMNFSCKKSEANFVYSKLRCLRKVFIYRTGTFKVAGSPKASCFSLDDLSQNQSNGRSSLSTPSNMQKVRTELENLRSGQELSIDQVLPHLELAQKDYSKSIKDIEKKCDKQMRKLLQRQQEEREEFEKRYEQDKADIERKQRTEAAVIRLHSGSSLQLATMNKLQERKAQWIEGVKSWAHAELINKPPSNESGYDQENTVTLNSCSKEQTPKQVQSMPDGDFPLEVPETVRSNEDVLPGVLAASEPMSNGATSNMLEQEVILEVPQIASVRDVSEDVVSVNSSPSEEQIPDEQITLRIPGANSCNYGPENSIHKSSSEDGSGRVALMVPDREFPLGVTEIVSSTGGMENGASVNPSPSEGQTSARTTSCMDGREVLLEVPEKAPLEAEEAINTAMDKDGVASMVSDNAFEVDKQNVAAVNLQNGESLLEAPENNRVNQPDEVVPLGVCETSVVGSGTTGQESSGVCVTTLPNGTGVDRQAEVLPPGGFETATVAEVGSGPTWIEIDRIHAVASDSSQPTESCRLQDRTAQVCDSRIASQQIDASASQPVVVSIESPNDAPVRAHSPHVLPSIDSPTSSQPPSSFVQHVPIDLTAVGGPQTLLSNTRTEPVTSRISDHSATAPAVRMFVWTSQDPLQNELDRIRAETDQIIKIHEDTKLRLKSDCEKEIQEVVAQIRRTYDFKLKDIEYEFLCKKKEMDDNQNKVLMNKILAEAFRTKCKDTRASSTPVRQQEMTSSVMQQLPQPSQPSTQRPSIVAGAYSTGLPEVSLQTTPTSAPPAPPLQAVHCSTLFSATPTRPPHISSISPTTSNLQVGTEIRAPAPHLQHFRPSASISATCFSSFPSGILQHVPTTSPTLSEFPSPAPATVQQSDPRIMTNLLKSMGLFPSRTSLSRPESLMEVDNQTSTEIHSLAPATVQQSGPRMMTNLLESMGIFPSRTSLSRPESLMDFDNQTSADATQPCSFPPLTDLSCNINPLAQASEVVCLSDDD